MAGPPDLWGSTPIMLPGADRRWIAVKDAAPPRGAKYDAVAGDVRALDFLINREINYEAEMFDSWARPRATTERGAGDCEDFALLKRAILLDQGVNEDRIYFLLVYDKLARCDHAVLLVENAGEWLVLDCRRSLAGAVTIDRIVDFAPLRAMQRDREWKYRGIG